MYNTIGIMGAMPQEIAFLNAKLENKKETKLGGNTFYEGNLKNKHIVLVCAGIGKVNAAAATQLLATSFNVNCVIFSGIAGNMTSKISVGDVVISDELVYHDAENRMIADTYPNMQIFKANENLVACAKEACNTLGIKNIVGKIATGDLFIGDTELKNAIAQKCNPDCVEMEGAAVAHVCAKNDIPFVVLRAMSDDSDEDGFEKLVGKPFDISEYCKTAALICENVVLNI